MKKTLIILIKCFVGRVTWNRNKMLKYRYLIIIKFKFSFILLFFLTFSSSICSNEIKNNEKIIENLLNELEDSDNVLLSTKLKRNIWFLWNNNFIKDDTGKNFSLSIHYLEKGDLKNAEILLSKIVKEEPSFLEARNKRALLRYLKSDYTGSKKDIFYVLSFQKRHFGAIHGLGLIYLKNKKYKKAFEQFKILNKIDPMNQENIAILYYLKKNYIGKNI